MPDRECVRPFGLGASLKSSDRITFPSSSPEAHVVQFYTDDDFLLDGLAECFADALQTGQSVIAVMTECHRESLYKRLVSRSIPVEQLSNAGRFLLLDAEQALLKFMNKRGPNRSRFLSEFGSVIRKAEKAAAETNVERVVVFGEMVAVLWAEGKHEAAIALEQLWNELARTHFFYLRCAYPAHGFDGSLKGEPYAAVCAEHSVVIPA